MELISPAPTSQRRGGGLPSRGTSVTVLETKAANGKDPSSSSPKTRRAAIASNVPEALITGLASSSPQNSTVNARPPARSAPLPPGSMPGSRDDRTRQPLGLEHRAVQAQPNV